jgi:Zn-dependent protease
MSVVIHEVSHGYAALHYGDETAKNAGRLTLNPIKHLDLFGSVLLPLILVISQSPFLIGWAKPVPYNPNNLRDQRRGTFAVAIAGVIANFFIAIVFSLLIRLGMNYFPGFAGSPLFFISKIIVVLNIVLAIFNLVPIPPLDGSKILFSILGNRANNLQRFLESYSIYVLLFFIFFLWKYFSIIIFVLFRLFAGVPF